ncbi:MAG: 2-amino-4-hydroxy-6-hydroxymethyldihydropteridine diphosphokinase [Thermodesulfobacteriota bacterium]|jgi:2-amino-4-hydroxy-6-hydroxymethyldihydropteridine diphosphokinase|nr:MAG: 2-amino-4-hydroxy-6-hydroxymethyldihydropteridine diphosphokinase [Thermodesulfobacteriota bacterium]
MKHSVFLGLGSNQGEKIKNCEQAIEEILKLEVGFLLSRSSWYYSEPWGREDQDRFVNGVIQIMTAFCPDELLAKFKEIEKRLGRKNREKWGPRVIDIDILFYDDLSLVSPEMEIPHPRIGERNFVLIPFAEIAPQFVHPVLKRTIKELLETSPDQKKVVKVSEKLP